MAFDRAARVYGDDFDVLAEDALLYGSFEKRLADPAESAYCYPHWISPYK
jgi:hypothetical protein